MKKIKISCPITATLNIIGGKWKSAIIWYLRNEPLRFGELHKKLANCSLKVFNQDLKQLVEDGIIDRKVFAEVPPRVEYAISTYGKTLLPIIVVMREWGVKRLVENPELMKHNFELQNIIKEIKIKEGLGFLNKFKG